MTATVRTPAGELTIDHQALSCPDLPTLTLAQWYMVRYHPSGIDTSDPEPNWTIAQELATVLDGLAVPGPTIEYTPEDAGRIY